MIHKMLHFHICYDKYAKLAVAVYHPLTLDMLERISNKEAVNRNKLFDISDKCF